MPRRKSGQRTVVITLHVPEKMLRELDRLVEEGRFRNRSEAIRFAIAMLLWREQIRKNLRLEEWPKPEVA